MQTGKYLISYYVMHNVNYSNTSDYILGPTDADTFIYEGRLSNCKHYIMSTRVSAHDMIGAKIVIVYIHRLD